jgi:metal-responsive CopG/Arc/MetJ family transcriptional regulator
MEEEKQVFVNVPMPSELQAMLDEMVDEDDTDRSKFIRNLIRQEYERRNPPTKRKIRVRTSGPAAIAA